MCLKKIWKLMVMGTALGAYIRMLEIAQMTDDEELKERCLEKIDKLLEDE